MNINLTRMKLKTISALVLTACFLVGGSTLISAAPAKQEEDTKDNGQVPVFKDGMAQPILKYTNLRNEDYTNEDSDILRFCVYVETDHDTDSDGKADLVEALVQVPKAAAEGDFKAGTIYDPTPYGAGVVAETEENERMLLNPTPFDYDKLYEPGKKRSVKGSMTTLEAAEIADPECWNYRVPVTNSSGYSYARLYDYYLVRGFAVVEAGGIGTYGSEGFELCGFDLEMDAHKCVVEWLAGDRVAFTDPYNDIEIKADWSNGNVAMTGCSYGGTLPFEVATSGVNGLKTIIPYAGIASWYDYTNFQGAPRYNDAAYAYSLASFNSGAAFVDDEWTVINDDYASFLWQFEEDQNATNGDYDDIWEKLDYTLDPSKINCSALIVHGMNDFNVTTKNSDLMARAFMKAGQPFKLVLHQDGHNYLNGIIVNGDLWERVVNKWLSHYLYDVDNGIEDMPAVSIQSNVDGSFINYDSWDDFEFDTFEYDRKVNPDDVSHIDTTVIGPNFSAYCEKKDEFGRDVIRDDYYLNIPDSASASYVYELPDDYTFAGVCEVHLKMSTKDVDKDGMVVSAMLLDTIDGETDFKAYMTKTRLGDVLPTKTIGMIETGGGLTYTKVKEFVKSNTTAKLISFGYTDLKNYGGGYEGKDYRKHEDEMEAGEYYDYTIYLMPSSYTFEPGHKAVLVITGWDPYNSFFDMEYGAGLVSDSSESEDTYAFNIDNSSLELRFPVEEKFSESAKKKDEKLSKEDTAVIDQVVENFKLLASTPRQSKHEKAISDKLKSWAEDLGYEVTQNKANDLIFDVPASKGYEDLPLTALQTHMDMVCVAEDGKDFDPQKDEISLIIDREAGTMTADGTTLGADDGAGVAMVMSIVEGKMDHGPLRIIITTDEEVEMTGALAITEEDLDGVVNLINIDSEDSDTVTISSAAGSNIAVSTEPSCKASTKDTALKIEISGLLGGHSGVMIGEGRLNGIVALADTLSDLSREVSFELVSFNGGMAENAIPAKAEAVILVDKKDEDDVKDFVSEREADLIKEYKGIEEEISLDVSKCDGADEVLDEKQTEELLDYICESIDGVYSMSKNIEGLVESSSNLGIIEAGESGIEITHMARSSSAEKLKEIKDYQEKLAKSDGLLIEIRDDARPWPVNPDSKLVKRTQEIYKEQNGEDIKVEAIHAGLECGAFAELSEDLDMISIGPDVKGAHSPEETLYLDSIPRVWHLLEELLK